MATLFSRQTLLLLQTSLVKIKDWKINKCLETVNLLGSQSTDLNSGLFNSASSSPATSAVPSPSPSSSQSKASPRAPVRSRNVADANRTPLFVDEVILQKEWTLIDINWNLFRLYPRVGKGRSHRERAELLQEDTRSSSLVQLVKDSGLATNSRVSLRKQTSSISIRMILISQHSVAIILR